MIETYWHDDIRIVRIYDTNYSQMHVSEKIIYFPELFEEDDHKGLIESVVISIDYVMNYRQIGSYRDERDIPVFGPVFTDEVPGDVYADYSMPEINLETAIENAVMLRKAAEL